MCANFDPLKPGSSDDAAAPGTGEGGTLREEQPLFGGASSGMIGRYKLLQKIGELEAAETMSLLGQTLRTMHNRPAKKREAVDLLRRALSVQTTTLGNHGSAVADTKFQLGRALYLYERKESWNYEEAETLQRQAIEDRRNFLVPNHPELAANLTMLSEMLMEILSAEQAEPGLTEAERAARPPDHMKRKRSAEVEAVLREALAIQRKILPAGHDSLITTLDRIGQLLLSRSEGAPEAELVNREELEILLAQADSRDPRMADSQSDLIRALLRQNKYDEAVETGIGFLKRQTGSGSSPGFYFLGRLNTVAWDAHQGGRPADGLELAEAVVRIYDGAGGGPAGAVIQATDTLGWIYVSMDRAADAIPVFEKALEKTRALPGDPNRDSLSQRFYALGVACQQAGEFDRAEKILGEALTLQQQNESTSIENTCLTLIQLGKTQFLAGNFAQAEATLLQTLAYFNFGQNLVQGDAALNEILNRGRAAGRGERVRSSYVFLAYVELGAALYGQQRFDQAEPLLLEGYEGLEQFREMIPGNRTKLLNDVRERIADMYRVWGKMEAAEEWRALRDEATTSTVPMANRP